MSDLLQAEGGVVQFKGRDQIALFQSAASPLPPISTGSRSVCESEVWATLLSLRTPQGVGLTKPGLSPDLSKSIMQQRLPFSLFPSSSLYLWDPAGTRWSLNWGVVLPQGEGEPVWEQGLTKCLFPESKGIY